MPHFELLPDDYKQIETLASPEVKNPLISISELEASCENNEELLELFRSMVKSCLDYTITVARFKEAFSESKGYISDELSDIDQLRSSVHNRTIADINIFSRMLIKYNKDNGWMGKGGMDGNNRAAYGKFALTLTLSRI